MGDLDEIHTYLTSLPYDEYVTAVSSFRHIVSSKYRHIYAEYLAVFKNLQVLERVTVLVSSPDEMNTVLGTPLRKGHIHLDIPDTAITREENGKILHVALRTFLSKGKSLKDLQLVFSKGPIMSKCESFVGIDGNASAYVASTSVSEAAALTKVISDNGNVDRYYLLVPRESSDAVKALMSSPRELIVWVPLDNLTIVGKSLGRFTAEKSPDLSTVSGNKVVKRSDLRQLVLSGFGGTSAFPDLQKNIGWLLDSKWFTAESVPDKEASYMVRNRGDPIKQKYKLQYPWDLLVPEWTSGTTGVYVFPLVDLF